jgi:hypothetical protein
VPLRWLGHLCAFQFAHFCRCFVFSGVPLRCQQQRDLRHYHVVMVGMVQGI